MRSPSSSNRGTSTEPYAGTDLGVAGGPKSLAEKLVPALRRLREQVAEVVPVDLLHG